MITKEAFAEAHAAHPNFKLIRGHFQRSGGCGGCAVSLLYLHKTGQELSWHYTKEVANLFEISVSEVWQFIDGWDDANHHKRQSDNPHYLLGYELAEQYMYS